MRAVAALALLGVATPALGQGRHEIGFSVVGLASDPLMAGFGPTGLIRLSRELGLVVTGLIGRRGDETVGRGEFGLRVDLSGPRARTRWYLAGGFAGESSAGREVGYLMAVGGFERGRAGRWWVEAGAGGGVRIAIGRRWPVGRGRGRRLGAQMEGGRSPAKRENDRH